MLNWLHACYGIGAAGGPAIMTAVLAASLPWQRGYALVAMAQLVLAAAFATTLRAWDKSTPTASASGTPPEASATLAATLRLPVAQLSTALFFTYTGLELATGTWAYTTLTEGRGVAMTTAGPWVTCYWIGLTVGRVLGALALRTRPVGAVLRVALLLLTASLVAFAARLPEPSDLVALVLAGGAAGPIFPSLIATTPTRVGARHAANAIGMQIAAAALGQALVPSFLGASGGVTASTCSPSRYPQPRSSSRCSSSPSRRARSRMTEDATRDDSSARAARGRAASEPGVNGLTVSAALPRSPKGERSPL